MSDQLLAVAQQRGLALPLAPHTAEVLGELAAEMFVRPLRTTRRMAREESYLASAQRRLVATPDGEVAVWHWGPAQGKLVGLVHGWDGHGAQLGAFAAPLVAAGFRVLTLDAPGHGESPGEEAHVPLLGRVLAGLEAHTGPFHALVGHSMGAAAAATSTRCGCQLRGLVLLAPPLSQLDRVERVATRLGLPAPVRDVFRRAVERRTATRFADADLMATARAAPCPLLVFHDPADPETRYPDSAQIVAHWPGARLVPCPGRGHYRILTTPEVIRRTVDFLVALP